MKSNLVAVIVLMFFLGGILTISSCKKDEQAAGTDKELYEMAKATSGFTWFKHSSSLLNTSSGSGHPQAFLRTRYNAVAATMLDSSGKIMTGATFPEGSLIVKELFDNATTLGRYAMLYKNPGSSDADAKGWVWGYINADGSVAEPASNKGSACISCHSQAGNIDYMLMNKYFP
ncbi:MAG TPA: cytochrome P460 family protein [Bacteroidales bacterium]|nr:cytochrome P460 family protein [Bacteroidales bacterium]